MIIWFITRSYPPQKGGGPQMRELQVEFLRKYYDVKVITINHESNELIEKNDIIYIPYTNNRYLKKIYFYADKFGLIEDSHIRWINKSINYLKNKISKNDIVFSSTGGELTSILLGNKLSNMFPSLKHIINYHDLLTNAHYDGERESKGYFKSIDNVEEKILLNCDYVISNSNAMSNQLIRKYSFLESKIEKMYFGFRNNFPQNNSLRSKSDRITIAHIGSVSYLQSPEILIKAWENLDEKAKEKIELVFIGDLKENQYLDEHSGIKKINYIPRNEMIDYVYENVDYAFISLINSKLFESAMPTKFYEYIGLELPIIGALPENCEALKTIEKYHFGRACLYDDIQSLTNILHYCAENEETVNEYKQNLKQNKHFFDSNNTLKVMNTIIKKVVDDQ